jgi:hypothetical protein
MKVKILVIIVLLFLIHISNITSQTPVKYNLKQGQVFHYAIESKGPVKIHYDLTFKVNEVQKEIYRIQLVINRFYYQDSASYYDSGSGLPAFGHLPTFYGYLISKPVVFSITKYGKFLGADNIGAIVDSISDKYYQKSFSEKTIIRQFISEEISQNIIGLIFIYNIFLLDNQTIQAFNKNNVQGQQLNPNSIFRLLGIGNFLLKKYSIKSGLSFRFEKFDSLRFDEASKMPVKLQLSYKIYKFLDTLCSDSTQIVVSKKTKSTINKTATIYGQITNLKSAVKINTQGFKCILFQNFNPDYKVFDVDSLTNTDGTFSFTRELNRPVEIMFSVWNKPSYFLYIQPGDSICLNVSYSDWDKTWKISGKGSEITTLIEQAKKNIHKLPSSYLDWEKNLQVDEEERYSIDPYWKPYNLKSETIDSLNNNVNSEVLKYIRTQTNLPFLLYDSDNVFSLYDQAWIKEIFEKFEKKGYSLLSFRFKRYLLRLLGNNYIKNTDYNSELNSPQKQYYFLKYNAPRTEICYYLMANAVYRAVRSLKVNEAKELLVDFKRTFPESEYALSLQNLISQKVDLSPGSIAPDFTLKDINDRSVSLSDFKDKWVLLFVNNDDLDYVLEQEVRVANDVKAKVQAGKFEVIWVMTGEKKASIDKLIKECSHLGTVLLNPGWKDKPFNNYKDEFPFQMHIISQGNRIEGNMGISLDSELSSQLIDSINVDESKKESSSISIKTLLWIFGIIVFVFILMFTIYRRRMVLLRLREARQREKLDLELKAIRSQLNPHFMFNSLSSIQHLVNDNRVDDANHYLSSFAGLMRKVLHNSDKELVPLENELDTIRQYLELEALRFNFKFRIDVAPNIDIFNTEIPPMLLQPFVENAVIHGIAAMNGNGEILVNVGKNEKRIRIVIDDNGTGISMSKVEDGNAGNGKGLSLTRKRMDLISKGFGNNMKFDITDLTNKGKHGTRVEISFESE